MGRRTVIYGPSQEALKTANLPHEHSRSYALPDISSPASASENPHFTTQSDWGPGAVMGLGTFKTKSLTKPFSTQHRDPASTGMAAVGFAVKF